MSSKCRNEINSAPVSAKAHAVLPLYYEILASRSDGFRKFQSILQQLALHDTVNLKFTEEKTVRVKHPSNSFDREYVAKTVTHFLRAVNADFGVEISVQQAVPVNCGFFEKESITAATLKLINARVAEPMSKIRLLEFANSVSNDQLCCTVNGTKYADMLDSHNCMITSLPSISDCSVIHIISKSTPPISPTEAANIADEYYGTYWEKHREHPTQRIMFSALREFSLRDVLGEIYNIYEAPISARFSEIKDMSALLYSLGADKTCTAGYSNTVIGFFADKTRAISAMSEIDSLHYEATMTEAI